MILKLILTTSLPAGAALTLLFLGGVHPDALVPNLFLAVGFGLGAVICGSLTVLWHQHEQHRRETARQIAMLQHAIEDQGIAKLLVAMRVQDTGTEGRSRPTRGHVHQLVRPGVGEPSCEVTKLSPRRR